MLRLSREQSVALALALVRTGWCAWCAVSLSLVHDEAQTFNAYLNGSWGAAYFQFNSNNHVLFSLLAKLSMTIFGVSEFALRLPTVIAGGALMLGFWLVLEYVPSRAVRWIAYLTLALHPLMLDFSVAARGYGLSLAFLVWALYAAMKRHPAIAGTLLGLSVSANFNTALPAAGMIGAAALLAEGKLNARVKTLVTMAGTSAAMVGAICGGALRVFQRSELYAGVSSFHDSLYNLIFTSIHATPRLGLVDPWRAANVALYAALIPIGLFVAVRSYQAWRAGDRITPLAPLALALALSAMIVAHRFVGLLYPLDRTGLPWMLLFAVAWAVCAGTTGSPLLRYANLLAACLLAAQFVTQFHGEYLTLWWYDRFSHDVAQRIESQTRDRPAGSVSISATWIHEPALEFYRVRDRVAAWKPVERNIPTRFAGYDYYVLNQPDTGSAEARALKILYSDSFTGVVLAR
jgi:hypothetical protein